MIQIIAVPVDKIWMISTERPVPRSSSKIEIWTDRFRCHVAEVAPVSGFATRSQLGNL